MKKKTHEILEKIRTLILSEDFKIAHRANKKNFIRNCLITLPVLTLAILNLMRKSLQSELNDLADSIEIPIISKQAFSAARKKLLPSSFVALNRLLIQEFYCDNEFKKFSGYRAIGVDGSTLQLPEGPLIKKKYGTCSNQKEGMSMARISHAYDLLNGITLDAIISPYSSNERTMAMDHILTPPLLIVLKIFISLIVVIHLLR